MKVIERFHPVSASGVLRGDGAHVLICSITAALILACWILGRIPHKPQVKDIVPSEAHTDAPLPRVYMNDSNWLTRFLDPLTAFSRGPELLKKGYKLFPAHFFRLCYLGSSYIIVDRHRIRELLAAPESTLSFTAAAKEILQTKYTLSPDWGADIYHTSIVRKKLTQQIPELVDEMVDELDAALTDNIPLTDEWSPHVAYENALIIVARISSRVFVGLPLCRNPEYLRHAIGHTVSVGMAAMVLKLMPAYIKPGERTLDKYVSPIFQERLENMEKLGLEYAKEDDMIQWLIDEAVKKAGRLERLNTTVSILNFASIHTSSLYIAPLREEIESTITEGWTVSSLEKWHKLDSFLKESIRHHPQGPVGLYRMAVKPYRFSNGVVIPEGTMVGVPTEAIHMDESIYERPDEFNAFRFSRLRNEVGDLPKFRSVDTNNEYLHFGSGSHACPGRFFAVTEIKLMLAFTLLRYDFRVKDEKRPADLHITYVTMPNPKAKVLFRKRV